MKTDKGHWDERPVHDRPMAGPGLVSYRYKGPYGFIMIGARDIRDALHEANRSLEYGKAKVENLQIWNDEIKEYEAAIIIMKQ